MIKNLLSNLPGLSNLGKGGDDLTPEELAAKEREDRIGFHRSKVRNGPVKFSIPTNGQIRRMKVRESKTHQRKQLEQARRQHWHGRRSAPRCAHTSRALASCRTPPGTLRARRPSPGPTPGS